MGDGLGFADFYRAVNAGRDPFPWQARLAARLADGRGWPEEIGVPTGMGKTSCADIAIWWLASQANLPADDRTAPTRIWWLVNRRLLVDATTDHVSEVSLLLADPERSGADAAGVGVLKQAGDLLRRLSARPGAPPLEVIRLRGGAATGRPTDPSQPAVILSTLPMYGSRLLFRGYGTSRSMRPVDAALAGTDSLVLVDEAHLAHHLMRLFGPLGDCESPSERVLAPSRARPTVVSLTATGATDLVDRFDLDAEDRSHPEVSRRLVASKRTSIREYPAAADPAKVLAEAAFDLLSSRTQPASCVVFANTPATARATEGVLSRLLAKGGQAARLVVLTGRSREHESAATRALILDRTMGAPAGRPHQERHEHLVVVATQTLEVGADVDFEMGVTEACGVRSLSQRLGRVNRLGRFADARVVYVHVPPKPRKGEVSGWPVYGEEPVQVLARLRSAEADGVIDLCPDRIAEILGPPGDDPGRAPEVMPALLWEWAKTTRPPEGEAPVEPFYSGLRAPERRVAVCWRAHVPSAGEPIWPRIRDEETVELPLTEARDVIGERLAVSTRLRADRVTVEEVDAKGLAPGSIVILPSDVGLLDRHGWAPESTKAVLDVSVLQAGLPLDAAALRRIAGADFTSEVEALVNPDDDDDTPVDERLAALIEALSSPLVEAVGLGPEEWNGVLDQLDLRRGPVFPRGEVPRLLIRDPEPPGRVDELDELSLSATAVALLAHGGGVGSRAAAVARAIGLSEALARRVDRAGRFHDVGKADARFQRWLDPLAEAVGEVAKSQRPRSAWIGDRVAAGWPAGGRHEALSSRLVQVWLEAERGAAEAEVADDPDLLIHLVATHHGHGRPFTLPVTDSAPAEVGFELDGLNVSASGDLSVPDWDQPARFRRLTDRYGHWGLALLEAILRQSDHAVSAGGWAGAEEVV